MIAMICVTVCVLFSFQSPAVAGTAGFQEYLIPGQEALLRTNYAAIDNNPTVGNAMHCVISVTASAEGTVINYDHWENGYGTPDQVITLNTGQYRVFESANIPANPRGTATYYDGGDRITVVGGPVFVTRASWPESPGVVMATAFEILPVQAMSNTFEVPVGSELNQNDRNKPFADFEAVILMVQSTKDNNTITIKRPNNTVLWTGSVNKGQSVSDASLRQIQKGSTVEATYPIQVQFLTGRAVSNSASEINGFTGVPAALWSNKYSAPVVSFAASSASQINSRSDVYLYNPNSSAITITYQDSTTGTFTVAAKELASYAQKTGHYAPRQYGVWFQGSDKFWGFSETGTGYDTWDWGSVLVPDYYCRNNYVVGWAPGDLDGENNHSSVFVMAKKPNTTVFVDYNQDNIVDRTLVLNFPQVSQITDPTDFNMSGAHIWGTDTLAMTYGEISGTPTPSGSPALDLGYTILPLAEEFVDQVLTIQKKVNIDTVVIGRPASFDIQVSAHSYAVGGITITEHLPKGWQYVGQSTTISFSNGAPAASAEPTSSGNVTDGYTLVWNLGYTLNTDEYITLVFSAVPTSSAAEGVTQNCAEVSGSSGGATFNPDDCMYMQTEKGASIGDHIWQDNDKDGVLDNGEPGLADIKLYLLNGAGAIFDSTTTNANGDYLFTNVPHGSYTVQVVDSTVPAGYVCTSANSPLAVTVQAGDSFLTADFGYGQEMDFGDAPDPSYPTLLANNGARHILVPGIHLGARVDAESDGPASANADGDDTNAGTNDDDGVVLNSALVPGDTTFLSISASANGLLNAWVDFNRDGDWNDQYEQVFTDRPLSIGNNDLYFSVPTTAGEGASYARFRFSSQGNLQTTGLAQDGEVEEYRIDIQTAPADLRLAKTVDTPSPQVNSNIIFTIKVVNDGPGATSGVLVKDILPVGLTYISDNSNGSYSSTTGIWQAGMLAAHDSVAVQITARVDSSGLRINTAEVQSSVKPDPDSTPGNGNKEEDDLASVSIQAEKSVDLSLLKQVNLSTPQLGDSIRFTITITNAGPDTASGVQIQDLLPVGLAYVSDNSSGRFDALTGIWSIGSLPAGQSREIVVAAKVIATGSMTNMAQVHACDQRDLDSTPANSAPNEDDQSSQIITVSLAADLRLEKEVDSPTPQVGNQVVFSIVITNDGPDPATNVSVKDQLPAGLVWIADNSLGAYVPSTGIWSVGDVAVSEVKRLSITAQVEASGTLTNIAQIKAAAEYDPDSTPDNGLFNEDDQDSATVRISSAADLELNKSASTLTANVDDQVAFTLTVTNHGPDEASGVQVQEVLPAGLMYVSDSSHGDYNPSTGLWTLATLAAGGTDTLQIITRIGSSGSLVNTAQVYSSDQYDPNSTPNNNDPEENDQDSTTLTVAAAADLQLAKSVDNPTPNLNSTIIYTLTVTNDGPDAASGVQVEELLPAGLAWISDDGSGSYNYSTGIWDIGDLAVHSSAVLHISAKVLSFDLASNTAEVRHSDQYDPDSTPGNSDPQEDDQKTVLLSGQALDFGDAPNDHYPSAMSANGARHIIVAGMHLGATVDADPDGEYAAAAGDDNNNSINDEDGVVFTSAPAPGITANVAITASAGGFLNAWADFNRDSDWDDAGEQIFHNQALANGSHSLVYLVPANAVMGSTFFRFRFSTQRDLLPTGLAQDGEVEDYQVDVLLPVELSLFVARMQNGAAVLEWSTQSETENIGFHVYRADSLHGVFRQISDGIIRGAGTTQAVHNYSFTDPRIEPGKTYYYKLADIDFKGNLKLHGPVQLEVPLPSEYALLMNYPNPFNPETKITFRTKEAGYVRVNIYNVQGQLVRQLVTGQYSPGTFSVMWNGRDDQGQTVTSGVYIYTMEANGFKQSRKMNFVK
jgi:uncharacterized repeat protein (TIGR01451 family)